MPAVDVPCSRPSRTAAVRRPAGHAAAHVLLYRQLFADAGVDPRGIDGATGLTCLAVVTKDEPEVGPAAGDHRPEVEADELLDLDHRLDWPAISVSPGTSFASSMPFACVRIGTWPAARYKPGRDRPADGTAPERQQADRAYCGHRLEWHQPQPVRRHRGAARPPGGVRAGHRHGPSQCTAPAGPPERPRAYHSALPDHQLRGAWSARRLRFWQCRVRFSSGRPRHECNRRRDCPQGHGLQYNEDAAVAELLRNGRAAEVGESGEVVITSLGGLPA